MRGLQAQEGRRSGRQEGGLDLAWHLTVVRLDLRPASVHHGQLLNLLKSKRDLKRVIAHALSA